MSEGGTATSLKAITINGAISVESEEEEKAKRRRKRKSRWNTEDEGSQAATAATAAPPAKKSSILIPGMESGVAGTTATTAAPAQGAKNDRYGTAPWFSGLNLNQGSWVQVLAAAVPVIFWDDS